VKKTKGAPEPSTVEIESSATSEAAVLQVISGEITADKAIALVKKEFGGLIIDCSTPAGFADAMKTRSLLIKMRTSADKRRKELDEPDQARIKSRMAAYKLMEPILLQLEAPFDRSIKAQQAIDKENERLRAEAEKKRVDGIRANIEQIKVLPLGAVSKSAAQMEELVAKVSAAPVSVERFAELTPEAEIAKAAALTSLKEMLATKMEQEAEAERTHLAVERARVAQVHREYIAGIRDWPRLAFRKTSAEIEQLLAEYVDLELPSCGDLQAEADDARAGSIMQLMQMAEAARLQEEQAEELARLRAAQPKLAPVVASAEEERLVLAHPSGAKVPVETDRSFPGGAIPANDTSGSEPWPVAEAQEQVEPKRHDPREAEVVTITRKEYESLLEDSRVLNALRSAGVDSWDGYDFAIEAMEAA
jgi:hypothetical protein